jgi:hypothetical protein
MEACNASVATSSCCLLMLTVMSTPKMTGQPQTVPELKKIWNLRKESNELESGSL